MVRTPDISSTRHVLTDINRMDTVSNTCAVQKKNAETFEKLTISIVRRHPLLENLGRSLERAAALAQLGKGPSVPFGVSQSRQSRAAERPGMVPIEFGLTWMLGHIRFRGIVLPNVIATGLRTLCGFLLVPVQKIQKRRHVLLSLFGRFR